MQIFILFYFFNFLKKGILKWLQSPLCGLVRNAASVLAKIKVFYLFYLFIF